MLDQTTQKLENMKIEANDLERDTPFMSPGVKKRGRGRPRKQPGENITTSSGPSAPPTSTENIETFKQILGPVFKTVSQVCVEVTDEPSAAMTEMEHQLITQSSSACINQYIPEALGRHANLMLFITISGTYSARIFLMYQAKKKMILEMQEQRKAKMNGAQPMQEHDHGMPQVVGIN